MEKFNERPRMKQAQQIKVSPDATSKVTVTVTVAKRYERMGRKEVDEIAAVEVGEAEDRIRSWGGIRWLAVVELGKRKPDRQFT